MKFVMSALFALSLASCTSPETAELEVLKASIKHGTAIDWYGGTVEQALAYASEFERPIFVYWGAVWCPPCNELKSQVFVKDRANVALKPFVRVFLDGDSDEAQRWADRFKVGGYPTMLVLTPDAKEVLRVAESVNVDEFVSIIGQATTRIRPLKDTIEAAAKGDASDEDYRVLAGYSWYDAADLDVGASSIETRRKIADAVPTKMPVERAILTARMLSSAAAVNGDQQTQEVKAAREKIAASTERYLTSIFATNDTVKAARGAIVYDMKEILDWLLPIATAKETRTTWNSRWNLALEQIASDKALSHDLRIMVSLAKLQANGQTKDMRTSDRKLVESLKAAVQFADAQSKTDFERMAVIPTAAYALQEAGDASAARDLLNRELKRSKTPWYLYSSLASLEEKLGNKAAALKFAEKARESVKGKASRIQWVASDLLMTIRVGMPQEKKRTVDLTKTFYDSVFSEKDGFDGRNSFRLKAVKKSLTPLNADGEIQTVIKSAAARCTSVRADAQNKCREHFEGMVAR